MSSILERHKETLATKPGDRLAFEALQEHYFLEGDWESLIALIQRHLAAPELAGDGARRRPILFRLAQVLEERCDRIDEAIDAYWEVARLDPRFRPALRQLRHIYTVRCQWDMVMQTAELEGQLEMTPSERAVFLADMGHVWLDQLDDAGEAISCFERAVEGDPRQKKALDGYARTLELFGRGREAAAMYERLVDELRGPERAPVLVRLGKLYAGPIGDMERATGCFRRAMTDDPRCSAAVEALLVIASAQEHWHLLGDLYERRFNLASGARHRSAIALEAGNMHLNRIGDREAARSWLQRAHELAAEDLSVHLAQAELDRAEGDNESLTRTLDRIIELTGKKAPVGVLLEASELHAEAGRNDVAVGYLERAQLQKPDDPLVLEALSDALSGTDRASDLARVLEARAGLDQTDAESQTDALVELARLQEGQLDDAEAAVQSFEQAFRVDPTRPDLITELERCYRKAERFADLRSMLERALEHASGATAHAVRCSLGQVLVEHLGDPDTARSHFEAVLEAVPDDAAALAGLERIAAESGDEAARLACIERQAAAAKDPERFDAFAAQLCAGYEAADDPARALVWARKRVDAQPQERDGLVELARLQRMHAAPAALMETLRHLDPLLAGAEQARNRFAIAELERESGNQDGAIRAYESAIESDPKDVASLRVLSDFYRGERRTQDLVRVVRRLADAVPQAEAAVYLDELARLLDEEVGDSEAAIVVLWRLVASSDAPADASGRLESLLERTGRFEELAQQLVERRRLLDDDSEEAEKTDLQRARLLLDKLGQLEQAATLFRAVRSRNPGSEEATLGLEQALRSGDDAAGLAQLLESRARDERAPEARAKLLFERAVLLEESLGDEPAALVLFSELCDATPPTQVSALAGVRLERLLERRGDWSVLRARLESQLEAAEPAHALALHERLAALCKDRVADREGAIEHLEAIGAASPERSVTWQDLAGLYAELDRDADVLRAMAAELECRPDPDRELVLRARSARLGLELDAAGHDAAHLDAARAHYTRVLELDPNHADASEFLIDDATRAGDHAAVARILEARLAQAETEGDDEASLSLRLRLATLYADSLSDTGAAISFLEAAQQRIGPVHPVAMPLADLYERSGDDEALVELARRATTASDNADDRACWMLRLAETLHRSGSAREAADAYCSALADRPGDRGIQSILIELYRELEDAVPLAALLEVEVERVDRVAAIPLRLELAGLLAGPLERSSEALAQLEAVLQTDPGHRGAFDLAIELGGSLGDPEQILGLLDSRLEALGATPERATLLEKRGQLLASTLERPEEAATAFREAISLDPSLVSARHALREVMERLERWPAVLDCLHLEAREAEGAERIRLLERAVEIAREHVSLDAMLPWLERLRAEAPGDAGVVARMAEVHRGAGRPEALLRALEIQLELTEDVDAIHDLHIDRARTLDRDLHSPARAIAAFETARALKPQSSVPLEALDRLYDLTGRIHERTEIVEARIALVDGTARIPLLRDAAALCVASLADPDRAIPHLLQAVALARQDADARSVEVELLRELGETLRAAGRIDAWVRASEAELAILSVDDRADRQRAAELHHELAMTCQAELGLPNMSLAHLNALLALDQRARQSGEALLSVDRFARAEAALIGHLRANRNHHALAERLTTRVERGDGTSDDWLELAQLYTEALHAPTRAKHAYLEVLASRPNCRAAIRGLRHVAECLGDWSEVARSLDLELALDDGGSAHEIAATQRRLGDVCAHRLDAAERGADAYRASLEAVPGQLEPLRSLEQLLERLSLEGELCDRYEQEVELLGEAEPERRHHLWLEIARLCAADADTTRRLRAFEAAGAIAPLPVADQKAWSELYRANDDLEHFADTFSVWCDHPEADAGAWDHLALVGTLRALGRNGEALARARRATDVDASNPDAWDAIAELLEQDGDTAGAREALEQSAQHHPPRKSAERLMAAAALCPDDAREEAARLLRRSTEQDPGFAIAHARLAVVAERLERFAEAATAAGRALDISGHDAPLPTPVRRDTGLIGGRSAQALGHLDQAAAFFAGVLDVDAQNIEALDRHGAVLYARGDFRGAQKLMETRIELGADDPERAMHLAMVGRGLEQAKEDGPAMSRYREALGLDATLAEAHEGILRLHDRAGDRAAGVTALRARIHNETDPIARAAAHLEAGRRLAEDADFEPALSHLRDAVRDDAGNEDAWTVLCRTLSEADRKEELLETSAEALGHVEGLDQRAEIALARGRLLDAAHKPSQAVEAYAEAVAGNPLCVEAALAQGRLLRGMGDWAAAAQALERFANDHPTPDSIELARVYLEWGRLMAGPLENVERAVHCYEHALALDPKLIEAREPLAALLAHVSERWEDAVESHAALLAQEPTRQSSMRALLEIARRRNLVSACDVGLALLRALGAAAPEEESLAPGNLPIQIAITGQLEDPIFEAARRICVAASQEIATTLGENTLSASADTAAGAALQPIDAFRLHLAEAEARLSAPGLWKLDLESLDSLIYTVTALAADPGGNCNDGPYLYSLDENLGRWSRRKIRKILGDITVKQIQAIDYAAWREALRDLAACEVLNADGDLRTTLLGLAHGGDDAPELPAESIDIGSMVAGAPAARRMLGRVVNAWTELFTGRR